MSAISPLVAVLLRARRDRRGAAALEYALVMPIFLLLTIGLFELGLLLFDYHKLNEATRRGLRQGLIEVPVADLTDLETTDVTCTHPGAVACSGGAVASIPSFERILAAMQEVAPEILPDNVTVSYSDSGISGSAAGLPNYVTPLVTVSLRDMRHRFFFLNNVAGFDAFFAFPPFATKAVGATVEP